MLVWVFLPSLNIRGAPKIVASAASTCCAVKMGATKGRKAPCDGKESVHRWLTDDYCLKMAAKMLEAMDSDRGVLPLGFLGVLAKESGRDPSTMTRLYQRLVKNCFEITAVISHKKCGRKPKYKVKDLQASTKKIPVLKRRSLCPISHTLGIPLSTIWDYKKRRGIVTHRHLPVKPLLTPKNRDDRIQFAIDRIDAFTAGAV
jgi:hypothetical protein